MISISGSITRITLQKLGIVAGVAGLFCTTKLIQIDFLSIFALGPRASFFYLPAAVITLGSLVSPPAALTGIFIGNLMSNIWAQDYESLRDAILISLVPVIAAAVSVYWTAFSNPRFREFHDPHERFSQIDALDIFYFCCLYSVINVSLSKLLFLFEISDPVFFPPIMVFGMAFGDLTGSFLVFVFLNLMFSLYLRLRR